MGQGPAGRSTTRAARTASRRSSHTLDQFTDVDQLLLLTTRALDLPGLSPPENVHVTGARLDDPVWTEPVELPPGDEPLVLVGLSSTFMDQSDAITRIAQALGELPVRGADHDRPGDRPRVDQRAAQRQGRPLRAALRGAAARRV